MNITRKILRKIYHSSPVWLQGMANRKSADLAKQAVTRALKDAGIVDLEQNDFNNVLHHLRGRELMQLPKEAKHFISVGCAGTWYFNWIEKCCGPIELHTGIEYYSPKPDDLPAGVEWIVNTAGDMSSIENGVGDILFSGQNLEHLWPGDVTAFLRESWRVLKPGGLLVIDSPNRFVTERAVWSHPEHTVEITASEARELVEASGFEVTALRGMWICIDPQGRENIQIDLLQPDGQWPVKKRISEAVDRPNESFCWWLEARKLNCIPDMDRTDGLMKKIFRQAWPERVNRFRTQIGTRRDGAQWLDSGGSSGFLMFGPYMPLPAGDYSATFRLRLLTKLEPTSGPLVRLDIIDGNSSELGIQDISVEQFTISETLPLTLNFHLDEMTFGIQFRAFLRVPAHLAVLDRIELISQCDSLFNVV